MARDICVRCKVAVFTTDEKPGEHICSDIRKRHARRTKQKAVIMKAFHDIAPWRKNEEINNRLADAILKGIVGMLAEDD